MPKLVYRTPTSRQDRGFPLNNRITSVGSGPDNDLRLDDPEVEDTHLLLQFDGRVFTLQSLARGRDPLVNGKARKKHELANGDRIQVGGTSLTFHLFDEVIQVKAPAVTTHSVSHARILEISRRLLARADVDSLLEDIMDGVVELTGADSGFLILRVGDENQIRVARNLRKQNIEEALIQYSDSIVETVLASQQPLILSDANTDARFNRSKSVTELKLASVLCAPLVARDRLLGLIYLGSRNAISQFQDAHLETTTIFAAQASLIISNALLMDDLRLDNQRLRRDIEDIRYGTIIGTCDAMREVYRRVDKVAATDVTVLVLGETGTGKELIAREIHNRSDRRNGPFVTINCGAIPENLLESELFGHVRGAFTGATANKPGKFHAAHGGTLFLDEIGEMPMSLQVKILRALQERSITRVGETRPEQVDIRIVAATHRNLEAAIRDGSFREDLYYRLNVVTLRVPPLRERGDDILLIARYLLDRYTTEYGSGRKALSKDAVSALRRCEWPGNIRQLENHIRKAVILSDRTTLTSEDLDLSPSDFRRVLPLHDAREEWQRRYITEVLELNGGNRTKTARDLGVDPRTVFRFLEKEDERGEDEL